MIKSLLFIGLLVCFWHCSPRNIFGYDKLPHYKETDSYQLYSDRVILRHSFLFDKYRVSDEEYSFGVMMMFNLDSLKNGKRRFDLQADSIYYFHQLPKIPFSDSRTKYRLVGTVDFLFWDTARATVKENISVIDSAAIEVYKYKGKRKFARSFGNLKLYFD